MKALIIFILSAILCALTYSRPFVRILGDGKYEASLNILNAEFGSWQQKYEVEISKNKFSALLYLSGTGIADSAVFNVNGDVIDGNKEGRYYLHFKTSNLIPSKIIDIKRLSPYSEFLKYSEGISKTHIDIIYRNKDIKIMKMGGLRNVVMYKNLGVKQDE